MTLVIALQDDVGAVPDAGGWLYVGEAGAWRVRAARTQFAGRSFISLASRVDRLRYELRTPYLEWSAELSQRNDSLEWWTSELAARNVYTHLYTRICALAAVREAIAESLPDGTVIVCSTPALADEVERAALEHSIPTARVPRTVSRQPRSASASSLKYRAADLGLAFASRRMLDVSARSSERLRRFYETAPSYRRRILAQRRVMTEPFSGDDAALLFTWVDRRNFDQDGRYRDPHFGVLPDLLRERGIRVAYLVRVLDSIPYADAVDRLIDAGEHVIFPDSLLEKRDWEACRIAASGFAPLIEDAAQVGGIPVAALAREHVDEYRQAHASPLSYAPLTRRLAAAGVRPRRVFHTWEGHSWELGLTWSANKHLPDTTVVGCDNGTFTRFALSQFASPREMDIRPYPHRVVTNGQLFHRLLIEEGFPPDRVRSGCAVRTPVVAEGLRQRPAADMNSFVRVLVATSITLAESAELIERSIDAFADDPRFELAVKPHPLVDLTALREIIGDLPGNMRFEVDRISDLLQRSDVVLYSYTQVCYEALSYRVPPVFVKLESTIPIDQLEEHPDARWEAASAAELHEVVDSIATLGSEQRVRWEHAAVAAIADAFELVSDLCAEAFVG